LEVRIEKQNTEEFLQFATTSECRSLIHAFHIRIPNTCSFNYETDRYAAGMTQSCSGCMAAVCGATT